MIEFIEMVLYGLLVGVIIVLIIPFIALGIVALPITALFCALMDIFSKDNH